MKIILMILCCENLITMFMKVTDAFVIIKIMQSFLFFFNGGKVELSIIFTCRLPIKENHNMFICEQ